MESECRPELWTLNDVYKALTAKGTDNKKRIVIPIFQRGLRWEQKKERTFIDSLTKNYPIGSLLFYRTVKNDVEYYTLIDGLQRGNTIKKFMQDPTSYFDSKDIPEEFLESIFNHINFTEQKNYHLQQIKTIITSYVNNIQTLDDLDWYDLYTNLYEIYPTLKDKGRQLKEIIRPYLKNYTSHYEELSNVKIPVIIYTGDESTLHEIFERINSKGVALTQYEIYAASWPSEKFYVHNDSIVNFVMKKYDALNDTEYEIQSYNRDELRINKMCSAFEYVFGLSKYLYNNYPILEFGGNTGDDEINHMAFELLNACFFNAHKDIKDVYKIILKFKSNINKLETCLLNSIAFINNCIANITRFKGNNRNGKEKKLHSQWQIMSYIAFAFRAKYDLDSLHVKQDWKEKRNILKQNIWKYYVYDTVSSYWSDGGTTKIHTANRENRYLNVLSQNYFKAAIDGYFANSSSKKQIQQVSSPTPEDYVILNTIYLKIFTAEDQLSINKFDVEHICTKNIMKKLISNTNGDGLPISCIANLCYLPEYENRSKGSKTLYQDTNLYQDINYLENSNYSLNEIEDKFTFTTKNDLEWLDMEYTDSDWNDLKKFYTDFLQKRYEVLKLKFLTSLGY